MKVNVVTPLIVFSLVALSVRAGDLSTAEKFFKSGKANLAKQQVATYLSREDNAEAYEKAGTMFARLKDWDSSVHYLEIAVNREQNANYLYKLGIAYHQTKKTEDAVATFRKALALNQKSLPIIFALGEVLEYADDTYDARQVYADSLKKNPKFNPLYKKLCALNYQESFWKEAIHYCTQAVKRDKADAFSAALLAVAYSESQERDKAVEIYKSALKFHPRDPLLRRAHGLMFFKENSYEQAAQELGIAASLDPSDDEAMIFLARSLFELGRYEDARVAYALATRLDRSYRFEFLSKQKELLKKNKGDIAAEYQEALDKL